MESKGKGILGAIIGGFIGIIPMVLVGIFGFVSGWLGILCIYATYKGYCKMKGSRNETFIKVVVLLISGCYVFLTSAVFILINLILGAELSSLAGLMVIPFISLGLGYLLIKRDIWVYTNPNERQMRVAALQQVVDKNENYTFYFPTKGAITTARILQVLMYLGTIFACCIGMAAMMSGTTLGSSITIVSVIMLGFSMIYFIRSIVRMNESMQKIIVKVGEQTSYQVQIHKLNQIRGFDFSNQSALVALNTDYLKENEIQLLRNSIKIAIQSMKAGLVPSKDPLSKAITELRNPNVVSEGKHRVKISYTTSNGKIKTETISKIYPRLNLFYAVNMDGGRYYPNYVNFGIIGVLSIILACAGVVGFVSNMIAAKERMEETITPNSYEYSNQILDDIEKLEENQERLQDILDKI